MGDLGRREKKKTVRFMDENFAHIPHAEHYLQCLIYRLLSPVWSPSVFHGLSGKLRLYFSVLR